MTIMIGTEIDLYIFCKKKKNRIQDQITNTDGNLILVIINKVVSYRNLKKVRRFYDIDDQDSYFFI
jgi:hypothetical protein